MSKTSRRNLSVGLIGVPMILINCWFWLPAVAVGAVWLAGLFMFRFPYIVIEG